MNNNNTKPKRPKGRERHGVGVIIGGVILAAILLTSVFTFYITILNNDKAKSSYEIQSQQETRNKETEDYLVDRDVTITAGSVAVDVINTGSIPMVASHALLYCSSGASCTNTGIPIQDQDITSVLNPGESLSMTVGGVGATMVAGNTYTINVVSERGNILSSTNCTVQSTGTCSEDADSTGFDAVAQGTGSVQLDFKSFAAIFPDFQVRDGVDQTGRYTKSSDVKGYPGTNLYGDIDTIIVQRLRFLNNNDEQLRLTKNTAFISAFGGTKGNHPHLNYVCSTTGDPITLPSSTYNNDILLEDVPSPYDTSLGWHNVYFCRESDNNGLPLGTLDSWRPNTDYSLGINPVFMVMRAKYETSQVDYAQTIPYQAFQLNGDADGAISGLVACIYTFASNSATACDAQTSTMTGTTSRYDYSAPAGTQVYIHVNSGGGAGTSPYYVEWINHDGTSECLTPIVSGACSTSGLNVNRNILITIPASATSNEYYTVKVTDSSTTYGTAKVVLMTFHVT
jgi:hypothetical protein